MVMTVVTLAAIVMVVVAATGGGHGYDGDMVTVVLIATVEGDGGAMTSEYHLALVIMMVMVILALVAVIAKVVVVASTVVPNSMPPRLPQSQQPHVESRLCHLSCHDQTSFRSKPCCSYFQKKIEAERWVPGVRFLETKSGEQLECMIYW